MYSAILEAFWDTLKMLPLMIIIFIAIELFEHKYGKNFKPLLERSRHIGPIIGSVLGIIPQCGFSVISTVLFAEGVISTGTLISVYLATSDEAVPVILSQPDKIGVLLPLLIAKFVIAVSAGYIIDLVFMAIKRKRSVKKSTVENHYDEAGCCGSTCVDEKFKIMDIIKHSAFHTVKIFLYVLAVSAVLNISLFYIGENTLSRVFLNGSIFQPVLTSIIGLVPNCAISVAITGIFLKGGISFGSAIAGLSSSAGLGLIILFKEVKSKKTILTIIVLLLLFSLSSGIIINSVFS